MAKSNFDKFINKTAKGAKKKEAFKQVKKKIKKEQEDFFIEKKKADRAAKKLSHEQNPTIHSKKRNENTKEDSIAKKTPQHSSGNVHSKVGRKEFADPKIEKQIITTAEKPMDQKPGSGIAKKLSQKTPFKKSFDKKNSTKPELIKGVPFERKPLKKAEIPVDNKPINKPASHHKDKDKLATEPMPLNKYLAHGGVSSRRDAGELVKTGKVKVNGTVITEPGFKVQSGDEVTMNGKKIFSQKNLVYILLNKPKDFITTVDDPQGRKTVLDIVAKATEERIYPVGRLDRNTSGVLLLTNDGELAQRLTHPSFQVRKIYEVKLDKPLAKADFEKIMDGVTLEDGPIAVDSVAYADNKDKSIIGIEIHSGRNRIVRRLFEFLGYDVKALDRVMFANLTKKNVDRGKWRMLTDKEVRQLKFFNKSK